MQADGRARQSMGPHGPLLRVGERLRESLQGAARRSTDIKEDISIVQHITLLLATKYLVSSQLTIDTKSLSYSHPRILGCLAHQTAVTPVYNLNIRQRN